MWEGSACIWDELVHVQKVGLADGPGQSEGSLADGRGHK